MRPIAEEPEHVPDTGTHDTSICPADLREYEEEEREEEGQEKDVEVELSDDEITIHSISSANSNLRRRSPRGGDTRGCSIDNASSSTRTNGSSTSSPDTCSRHDENDNTPLVTNKRSSRMSYPKTLMKMGRDVFSPPRLSFLSPSQLERRRNGMPPRKRANAARGNSSSPDGSTGTRDGDGSTASGTSRSPAYLGPTELHNICFAAADAAALHAAKFHAMPLQTDRGDGIARATKVLSIVQREASIKDSDGRTAMHILSRNRKLSRPAENDTQKQQQHPDQQHDVSQGADRTRMDTAEVASVIDFVIGFLLPANPLALVAEDNAGQFPFEYVLVEWIRRVHNDEFGLRRTESNASFSNNIENSLQQVQNVVNQSLSVSRAALVNVSRSFHISSGGGGGGGGAGEGTSAAAAFQSLDEEQRNELGRSSSWTIESSGSTETITPVAADSSTNTASASSDSQIFDVDVESGNPTEGEPSAAMGERRSRSFSAINNTSSRKRQKSSHMKSLLRLPMENTERLFPLHGRLSSHAQLILVTLSAIIEKLEEDAKVEMRSISIRSTEDSNLYGASRSAMIRSRLIERIASIPNLMKTLLLIEDDLERNQVFDLPIIRATMLSRKAMGTWFTLMLRSETRIVSQRAVMYLGLLSNASGELKSQQHISSTNPDEIREAVLALDDLIPSLVGLDEAVVEQAATTPIIRKILDTMITRPFAVSVVFFDGLFLLLLIWSFRKSADGFVEGQSPDTVIKWIYVANANIFYFIIRELGKAVSLTLITRKAFWLRFFWGFWNVVDIFSILFSLVSTIFLRVQFSKGVSLGEESRAVRWCLSLTTGLLWLKVLSYLKSINMQLATFVLAVIQITKDLAWFLLILFAVVVSFSQMFYTLLLPEECANDENAAAAAENPACKPSEYYLSVYSVLLGDFGSFEREDFHTPFSVFLIVLFTLLVAIVLLNVLIAIVSDSYEKCLIRSQYLFGRARVMILAELISFQNLLRKDKNPVKYEHSEWNVCRRIWMRQRSKGWSKGSLIFFALSMCIVFIWFIGEMVGYAAGESYGDIAFSLGSICVNVGVLLMIVAFLSQGTSGMTGASSNDTLGGFTSCWYRNSIQRCMVRLLGTSESSSFDEKLQEPDSWRGRAIFVQREMIRTTAETQAQIKAETKALEGQIYSEIGSLERRMLESEATVMSEIKASEQRIETILRDVVLALGDKDKIAEDSSLLRASA